MERDFDPCFKRILENASYPGNDNRAFPNNHSALEPLAGFSFQPAPQRGQDMSLVRRDPAMRERGFDTSEYNSQPPEYLNRPASFELDESMKIPAPYSSSSASSRLTLPSRDSHSLGQTNSGNFGERPEPRVLNSAANHFQVLQDLQQTAPKLRPSLQRLPLSQTNFTQQQSPTTQLANSMMSQTSMPLQKYGPPMPPNVYHTQSNRLREIEQQSQQASPPSTRSIVAYRPDYNSSVSPPYQSSSPSARVSQRRNSNRQLSRQNRTTNEIASPHTPEDQTSPNGRYAPPSRAYSNQSSGPPSYPSSRTYSNHSSGQRDHPHTQPSYSASRYKNNRQIIALGSAPPMAHGIQLVSPHELPDRFRQVFPYELFNAVQSKCFMPIYKTNDNLVVSAPTGSGKTVLLELAICKLVEDYGADNFKIVYQAPIKSLCSERMRDWSKKFSHLNLRVAELTGDTSGREMSMVGSAHIIVTTPEKWDSITRKWKDHQKLLQLVKLFLIDEVHILKDIRGATLEAVVCRMKSQGASLRIVALSATVPNSQDIATWLGKDSNVQDVPAHRETFGEEFRPVKLQKHVHGYDNRTNDFAFEKILDGKLPALIQKYSCKKPIMVFCFTRKSCEGTAAILAEHWTRQRPTDRAWPAPTVRTTVEAKDLQQLVGSGVAYHHAGLDVKDRAAVETAYLKGDISVICCTSTLAVGVNLPCHLVVLKGTVGFTDSGLGEYSDLEVMQMLGRAGRPQFDDSAVAIVMTRLDRAEHYKKMISGQDYLESTLHLNLIEHLNSEIGLGTIDTSYKAKVWLGRTFLSVRMRQNPDYYKLAGIIPSRDTDQQLELACERDITLLQNFNLVTKATNGGRFTCTEYGEAMSRYMVQFETMKLLLGIPRNAKREQILHTICQATEFKDLRMKPNERACLREFNKSALMKFPIKDNISTTAHKVFLMIQVQLGGIEPSGNEYRNISRQFSMETGIILDRFQRLVRCVVDCKAIDCDGTSTRCALELARSVAAGYWEDSSLQLLQVPNIGPATLRKLVNNHINSLEKLVSLDTMGIERVVGKNPPFGKKMRDDLVNFPQLKLTSQITSRAFSQPGTSPKVKVSIRLGYTNKILPKWQCKIPAVSFMAETSEGGVLVHFWRGNIKALSNEYGFTFIAALSSPDDQIKCYASCEEIVGTMKSSVLKPEIPASEFPPPPPKEVEKPKPIATNDVGTADEFDDDIDDEAMLAAVKQVESTDYGSDGFVDVDTVVIGRPSDTQKKDEVEYLEPVKMENGKWACNHHCRDGNPLKNGQLCKHKCCREGLDKPRKVARKKSNIGSSDDHKVKKEGVDKIKGTLSKPHMNSTQHLSAKQALVNYKKPQLQSSNVEVIDLSKNQPPVPYSELAPREYRKLHNLHTSIQEDKPIRLPKQAPRFSFSSGKMPDISCMEDKDPKDHFDNLLDPFDSDGYDEFPSPSAVICSSRSKIKPDPEAQSTLPTIVADKPDELEFEDGSISELEAAMIGLDDSRMLRPATPKMSSSFANGCFDFEAFNTEDVEQFSSPLMSQMRKKNVEEEDVQDASSSPFSLPVKRQQSSPWAKDFPDQVFPSIVGSHTYGDDDYPQAKRHRVMDVEEEDPIFKNEQLSMAMKEESTDENTSAELNVQAEKSVDPQSSWIDGFNADFLEDLGLNGLVDFVD